MGLPIGKDRIFSVYDVSLLMGCCYAVAIKIMKESGHCLRIHRRLYIFESDLGGYLRTMGVA